MGRYGVTCDSGCAPYQSASCGEGGDPFADGCAECTRDVCNDGGGTPVDWTPELWANTTQDSDAPHMVFYAETVGSVGSGRSPDAPPHPKPKPGDPKPKPPKPEVELTQTEIMTNGPVSTCFRFYESFHNFFNENPAGIYNTTGMCKNKTGVEKPCKEVGGHCVKIVGWGHDEISDIDYWLVANSWTTYALTVILTGFSYTKRAWPLITQELGHARLVRPAIYCSSRAPAAHSMRCTPTASASSAVPTCAR